MSATPRGGALAQVPGVACPDCKTRFQVLIDDLLVLGTVTCPHCGLVLEVDRECSSLEPMAEFQRGTAEAQEMRNRERHPRAR